MLHSTYSIEKGIGQCKIGGICEKSENQLVRLFLKTGKNSQEAPCAFCTCNKCKASLLYCTVGNLFKYTAECYIFSPVHTDSGIITALGCADGFFGFVFPEEATA
jgi:hypothetical protein